MGLFRKAIFVIVAGVAISYLLSLQQDPPPPPSFGGNVQSGFESVEKAFRQNFGVGYEPDGAAFAVCYRGKIVVDLWGGYADKVALRPWTQDTMTMAFSSTKGPEGFCDLPTVWDTAHDKPRVLCQSQAVAALVMAVLVDRGRLKYEDLVTRYWPEFGAHGKSNVTVKMLVGHQAGLAALDGRITMDTVRNWRQMSKLFEEQIPNWPPGTDAGYHALTFGWLCDQLVRRVDPQHRSLGKYFEEEIAKPFGIDFHVGLSRGQLYRVARMSAATVWDFIKRLDDWHFIDFIGKIMISGQQPLAKKVGDNPDWLKINSGFFAFNSPDVQELEIASANGIGTARALARLFCLLDGSQLLNKTTIKKISQPVIVGEKDRVVGLNITWGWGFMHTKSPQGHTQLGHPGYGGQNVKFDPHEHVAYAYLRNSMAPDMGELTRSWRSLQHATYESVKALESKS